VWNGAAQQQAPQDGVLRLSAPGYRGGRGVKSPRLPGGIDDFFALPFAVVIGTTAKDAETRALCAEKAQDFIDTWREWQKHAPRVFRDTEITAPDIARYSLLLIGGPAENRVAAMLATKLPLRLSPDAVTIGGRAFEARDAAVQLLYPNPRNPERYVWIIAGNSAAGLYLAEATPYGLPDWEDYLVTDGRRAGFGQSASDTQLRVVSGAFDHEWRFSPALAFMGDAGARAQANRVRRPPAGAVDTRRLDEYVGRYQAVFGPVEVQRDGTRLFIRTGEDEADAIPQGGDSFYLPEYKVWMTFVRDSSGKVTGFNGRSGTEDIAATRLP
jgi:hypothetical protein